MPKRHGLWNKERTGYLWVVGPPIALFAPAIFEGAILSSRLDRRQNSCL